MKIGTRGSRLALAQAEKVSRLLEGAGVGAETVIVKTSGDVQTDSPLYALKGYGAFVREIDELLLKEKIDIAVHSLKDVPTERPPGLALAAVLKRESALDVAITRNNVKLADLPAGSVVGTSSTRRVAMIRRHYPGLTVKDIRGNVDTRLRKLNDGDYDAIILAEAGLIRLGMSLEVERLDPSVFVPASNQGVISIVAREGSPEMETVRQLNDHDTWLETRVERIIASGLDGGCVVPLGVFAARKGEEIEVTCEVLSLDGRQQVRLQQTIPVAECEQRAEIMSDRLALAGGRALADAARKELIR